MTDTPEIRLQAVDSHALTILAATDALAAVATLAYLGGQDGAGALALFLADRIRQEAAAIQALAAPQGGGDADA